MSKLDGKMSEWEQKGINVKEVLWSHREKYMGLSTTTEKKWSVVVFAVQLQQQAALSFKAIQHNYEKIHSTESGDNHRTRQ